MALLLTKFDRVLAQSRSAGGVGDDPSSWGVESLVESRYGMTRHALARHVPPERGAIFAVSAYGPGTPGDGRPPVELRPIGLEGPLGWLAEQLEARDREQLEWLWDLAPHDGPRLTRVVAVYERRYPDSAPARAFRARLNVLKRKLLRRRIVRGMAVLAAGISAVVAYDVGGYQAATRFERDHSAPTVARRWGELLAWHPTLPMIWPTAARDARRKHDAWTVQAAALQVQNGTAAADLPARLVRLKDEAPELAAPIREIEQASAQARQETRWKEVRAEVLTPTEEPEPRSLPFRASSASIPTPPIATMPWQWPGPSAPGPTRVVRRATGRSWMSSTDRSVCPVPTTVN